MLSIAFILIAPKPKYNAEAALHFVLARMSSHEEPRSLYKRVMAIFCMHHLEQQVNLLSPETASAERLRATMAMLKKVARKVAKLYRDEVDLPDMLHPLKCFRAVLDGLLRARGEQRASQYTLKDEAEISATSWFIPDMEADEAEDNGLLAGPSLSGAKKRAQKNLKSVETPSRLSASYSIFPGLTQELMKARVLCTHA